MSYVIGEDAVHPASELLIPGRHCRGWESPPDGPFPAEIVLQFMGVVGLKQVQFLSHQAKIASKIELFVYAPESPEVKLSTPDQLESIKFRKLGHISLRTNEDNGFTARELKSVNISGPVFYLKILFYKSYSNGLNPRKQVGIMAINCVGEETYHEPGPEEQETSETHTVLELDAKTLDRLSKLEEAKERALSVEDFDKAKDIKDAINKLRSMGKQLAMLEYKKAQAIENEDYPSAKIIKVEIDRLRGSVGMEKEEPVSAPTLQSVSAPKKALQNALPVTDDLVLEEAKADTIPERKKPRVPPKNAVSTSEDIENKNLYSDMCKKISAAEDKSGEEKKVGRTKPIPRRKAPPPTEQPEPQNEAEEREEQSGPTKAEPLSGKARKLAEPYFSLVALDLLEMLFSKSWVCRDAGLNTLKDELLDKKFVKVTTKDQEKVLVTMLELMARLITDKVAQVAMKAMAIVDIALQLYPHEVANSKSGFHSGVEGCLAALMEQIGDNNVKIRVKAHETCLKLAANANVGMKGLVGHMSNAVTAAKKPAGSARHLQGKIKLLNELVQTYGLETKSPTTKSVIDLAMLGAKHSNADVRNEGYTVLAEIYKILGAQINPYLEGLRPAQREMLEAEFKKAGGGSMNEPAAETKPETTITTNIRPHGGAVLKVTKAVGMRVEQKSVVSQSAKMSQEEEEDPAAAAATVQNEDVVVPGKAAGENDKTCEYCGKFDINFTPDKLDMHMYKLCPMLHLCDDCGNVVEIVNLTGHRLRECVAKKKYKECPVCKEAIPKEQLDAHVQEGGCRSYNPQETILCPLCHEYISPGTANMWKDHIVVKRCGQNPRKAL